MNFKIIMSALLIITISIFFGCGEDKGNVTDEHKEESHSDDMHTDVVNLSQASIKEIGLRTETISLKPFTGFMNIPAKVITNQDYEAQVGSLVQGRVHKVEVNTGDYVKAGQILMYMEGVEIGQIKSAYIKSKAHLDYCKADFERHKKLWDQNVGSKEMFYEAEAEYQKAFAEFQAEDKKIHAIGLDEDDIAASMKDDHSAGTLPVKAHISGIVTERNVVIGQLVDGTTNAFKIINTSSVWIDGQIYEKDINRIKEKINVDFTSASYPNEKFDGRITYIGQIIDEKSRTITIRAEFNNPDGKLKPQMFGELQVPVGKDVMAILIPSEAIIKINNEDFVFVQKPISDIPNDGEAFEKRAVVMGSAQNEFVEIKEGLKENEKVVVKGSFYLKSELMKGELAEDEH